MTGTPLPPPPGPGSPMAAFQPPPAPGLLPGDRFVIAYQQPIAGPGSATLTCRWCGQVCRFTHPRPERVEEFMGAHRCGLRGTAWHEGDDSAASRGVSTMASAAHAVSLGWWADVVEAEPHDTYLDDRAFANAQRLAENLHVKLSAVAERRAMSLRGPTPTPDRPVHVPAHMAGGRRR